MTYYKKPVVFLVLSIISACHITKIHSQEISLLIKKLPVRNGVIYNPKTLRCDLCDRTQVIIETKNDSCFSISDGKLFKSFQIDSTNYAILIKTFKGLFISYSMFKSVNNDNNQEAKPIKKGDFLGILHSDHDKNYLIINFINKKSQYYSFEKSIGLLKIMLRK